MARNAWKITDEDVAALRAAGFDEDAIFEVTIAAATGAGVARYQAASARLRGGQERAGEGEDGKLMRLQVLHHGHSTLQKLQMRIIRALVGQVPGPIATMS